jgi:uncharacterized protein (TIGR00288 family)
MINYNYNVIKYLFLDCYMLCMTKTLDQIALLVDGPNMYTADWEDIIESGSKYGEVTIKEVFLSKHTSEGLFEATINAGYCPVMQSIEDIDTAMAMRAAELICSPQYNHIQGIALATRDGDFSPAAYLAKRYNKVSIAIGMNGNGMSTALRKAVTYFESVAERRSFSRR